MICARDTYISSTCTMGDWIKYYGIGIACTRSICAKSTSVKDVKLRALIRSKVTLASPGINDCCL